MKRLLIRFSALAVIVVLGLIAIAQAQRGITKAADDAATSETTALPDGAPRPIALAEEPKPINSSASKGASGTDGPPSFARLAQARGLTGDEPAEPRQNPIRGSAFDQARKSSDDIPPAQELNLSGVQARNISDVAEQEKSMAPRGQDMFGMNAKSGRSVQAVTAAEPMSDRFRQQEASSAAPSRNYPRPAFAGGMDSAPPDGGAQTAADPAAANGHSTPLADTARHSTAGNRFGMDQSASPPSSFGNSTGSARESYGAASSGNFSPSVATQTTPAVAEGTGRPGSKQLEGPQTPHLSIEKTAPSEIQVGKQATFQIKVRNEGKIAAQDVRVTEELPKGTQLVGSSPRASRGPRGELLWELGTLPAGEEITVQLDVMPTAEGEIGSVASVVFRADVSVRTVATKPEIQLQVTVPKQVMIGDDITMHIRLSNPGSGAATGVVLSERVPSEMHHEAGNDLEFDVGELKPGETRELDLTLKANQAGQVVNTVTARGDASLRVDEQVEFEVIAPALEVAMNGPGRRYLERQASYTISVKNPGTAAAKDVELTTYLPRGLKFVKADNSGYYDAQSHSVKWSLEELPATETGSVQLTTLPIEEGEQKLKIEGKAQQGLVDEKEQTVLVEGVAAILFEVVDVDDPIEVGGETTYEIRVINQGSKAANQLQLVAMLPPELKPVSAEGPVRHSIEGQRILFEPLTRLAAKADTTYRVRAKSQQAGDARIKVQMVTDEIRQPVTKEESTRVYGDE